MTKLLKLAMLTALPLLTATAQSSTTYTIPPGQQFTCSERYTMPSVVETCFNGRPLLGSDGSEGYFGCCNVGGTGFTYTSPVSKVQVCGDPYYPLGGGTPAVWTIGTLSNGDTIWTMSCGAIPNGSSKDGPMNINLQFTGHSQTVQTRCGKWPCTITTWYIDSFELTLTPVA